MLNPHFVFNVINAIQHFINSGKKLEANLYLADFAKLIRLSSGFTGKRMILLEEELTYLELYLSFEKLRLVDKLSCEIIVDPAIEPAKILVSLMMIQPFMENAVWHGIQPIKEKGEVSLYVGKKSEKLLHIKVVDNGVGIQEGYMDINLLDPNQEGIKFNNIAIQRLRLLHKTTKEPLYLYYSWLHPEQKNKGTVAEFLLPFVPVRPGRAVTSFKDTIT